MRVLLTVVASFSPGWSGVNHLIALFIVFKKLEETFGTMYLHRVLFFAGYLKDSIPHTLRN